MANGQGNAAQLLQTVLGLSQAVQNKRAQQAGMIESFARMASMAPDAQTLSGLVSTYSQLGEINPQALNQMAEQLARRQENVLQREFFGAMEEMDPAARASAGQEMATRALTGRNVEAQTQGEVFNQLWESLDVTGESAIAEAMLLGQATGMRPGEFEVSGATADVAGDPRFRQAVGFINTGLMPTAQAAEQLRLGWAQLRQGERQLALEGMYKQGMLALQQKAAELEANPDQGLTNAQLLDLTTQMQALERLATEAEADLTPGQRQMIAEMQSWYTTLLNREGARRGLPIMGGVPGSAGTPYAKPFQIPGMPADASGTFWGVPPEHVGTPGRGTRFGQFILGQ